MAEVLNDGWEKLKLEEKLHALGFESEASKADKFLESVLSAGQIARLHEVLDSFAGASSIIDEIGEETEGSECETCKRVQGLLAEDAEES